MWLIEWGLQWMTNQDHFTNTCPSSAWILVCLCKSGCAQFINSISKFMGKHAMWLEDVKPDGLPHPTENILMVYTNSPELLFYWYSGWPHWHHTTLPHSKRKKWGRRDEEGTRRERRTCGNLSSHESGVHEWYRIING